MIVFESAGMSSLQDLGRYGLQNQGIGTCGAMDRMAARVANNLLGNTDNAALIEIALGGARLRIAQTQWFAITGADLQAKADGMPVELCRPIRLETGSLLQFKQPRLGCRAYLAVQDGFLAEPVLGSASTDVRAGLGGYHGRAFQRVTDSPIRPAGMAKNRCVGTRPGPIRRFRTPDPCHSSPARIGTGWMSRVKNNSWSLHGRSAGIRTAWVCGWNNA